MNSEPQNLNDPLVRELSESLMNEVVGAVGLPKTRFNRSLMWRIIGGTASRLAKIGVTFESIIGEKGLPAASAWVLSLFCHPVRVDMQNDIPQEGPLLVVANHPGAYDALILFSQLKRQDIRWISTEIPFMRLLQQASGHIIYAPRNESSSRMIAMRNIIRHLQSGGAMVYFGSGHRDPDPSVYPGAKNAIDNWLRVYDTFFKYVPGLKILPAIASGVVSERWARHPITWLRRKQIDKHRLAEFGQVITQLRHPGKLMITPSVTFGTAVSREELLLEKTGSDLHAGVVALGKNLLDSHVEQFGCAYL